VKFISTKSQVLELDLIVAVALFITVFFLFYKYSLDLGELRNDEMELLIQDGKLISSHLVTGGYPLDWYNDVDNVVFVGLTDGSRNVMPDKVAAIRTMNYAKLKNVLGSDSDFYAFFTYQGNPTTIDGIAGFGKPGVTKDNIMQVETPEDLLRFERLLFYDSKIITLEVYVW
jgi:hypothetical protein